MEQLFTLEQFSDYLLRKKIPDYCPCCQHQDQTYSAVGMEKRANVENEKGQIIPSNDLDDNVGLGLVETVINSKGHVTDIRFGALPLFAIRCNYCGFLRVFDAQFIRQEYKKLSTQLIDKED